MTKSNDTNKYQQINKYNWNKKAHRPNDSGLNWKFISKFISIVSNKERYKEMVFFLKKKDKLQ